MDNNTRSDIRPFEIKYAYNDKNNVKALFSEYTKILLELEHSFQSYLNLQNYDDEIKNLNGKYGLPDGRLYIAYAHDLAAGCIALRKISESECEMKRLYIRPQFRGKGLAKNLVELIVSEAKKIGYKFMLLDTLPKLESALKLYENMGFYRIDSYNNSPVENTVFMRLDLNNENVNNE